MTKLEVARQCIAINDFENAKLIYPLVLQENEHKDSAVDFECAAFILQLGGDYKLSFDTFTYLYNKGLYQSDIFDIMVTAFYAPNIEKIQKQYKKNCDILAKYPYIFTNDFLDFDELKIKFFPYDDEYWVPFYMEENRFGEKLNIHHEEVTHYFFKDLENPILAEDIYSQYELEYLNDNVRKSEWVARENHIYLHYNSFAEFCAYMQVLDWYYLLKDEKLVFLMEKEISKYPIDFKEEYGIDYAQNEVKPLDVREVKKLIWAQQLSSDNGGDFFNEVFDFHPNLLLMHSTMFDFLENLCKSKNNFLKTKNFKEFHFSDGDNASFDIPVAKYLLNYKNDLTEKDILVAYALSINDGANSYDKKARIVPAVFLQPHFSNVYPNVDYDERGIFRFKEHTVEEIQKTAIIEGFKYIKTFSPLRRFTTSYGSTIRFELQQINEKEPGEVLMIFDLPVRLLTLNYMVNPKNKLFKDARIVRFEDGKLNPRATFTALAEFLDLPYTSSMETCSRFGKIDARDKLNEFIGFDTRAVYRNNDDVIDEAEKYILEYAAQNAYKYYGYNFEVYDGGEMTEKKIDELFSKMEKYKKAHYNGFRARCERDDSEEKRIVGILYSPVNFSYVIAKKKSGEALSPESEDEKRARLDKAAQKAVDEDFNKLRQILKCTKPYSKYIDVDNEELRFMPLLEPKKDLLITEIYH